MKLVTSLAALAAGMLVLGACADDDIASDNAFDTREAQRDSDPLDRTYPATPAPTPNETVTPPPANPDEVTPLPPTPGDPPPPLPPN